MDSIGGELQFMTPRPFGGEQLEAIRSISTEGTRRTTSSASSTSSAVGAPKVVPAAAAS